MPEAGRAVISESEPQPDPIKFLIITHSTTDGTHPPPKNTPWLPYATKLVEDLRRHLLRSDCATLTEYQSILRKVHSDLPPEERRRGVPSLQELRDHIYSSFPTIVVGDGQGYLDTKVWSTVDGSRNDQLMIWGGVLKTLQPGFSNLMTHSQAAHLLIHLLIHELSHHLVRGFFGAVKTPTTVGPLDSSGKCGETGWLAEWNILGGSLRVDFPEGEAWNMVKAKSLIFQLPGGQQMYNFSDSPLSTSVAVMMSLKTSRLLVIDPIKLDLSTSPQVPAGRVRMRGAMPGSEVERGATDLTRPPQTRKYVSILVCGPVLHDLPPGWVT